MKERVGGRTKNLVLSALFAALIAVMSQVAVPMPSNVPVTLQTFGIALCGYVLGTRWGLTSYLCYLLTGAVGVPVFSGFKGGIGVLFGVTGGFLWGFIIFVGLCGASKKLERPALKITFAVLGLLLCHICGVLQFWFIQGVGLRVSFLTVSAPFLIKDVISVVLALLLSIQFKKLRI